MDFNEQIHIRFDLPRDQADLLKRYAMDNQEIFRSLGIIAVHLNDTVKMPHPSADQTPSAEFLRQQSTRKTQNTNTTTTQKRAKTIRTQSLTKQYSTSSQPQPQQQQPNQCDIVDDYNNVVLQRSTSGHCDGPSPSFPQFQSNNNNNNSCFTEPSQHTTTTSHQQHQQYKMPSPLLINLLNKEANTIDISKNLLHMSDDYKQIYNLREILANVRNQQQDYENKHIKIEMSTPTKSKHSKQKTKTNESPNETHKNSKTERTHKAILSNNPSFALLDDIDIMQSTFDAIKCPTSVYVSTTHDDHLAN